MSPLDGVRNFIAAHTEISSARNQQDFPNVPPSLNPNDHELKDYYASQGLPPNTAPYYTPYLGLSSRLSQVWLNRWTILLALIVYIDYDLANAKAQALSACTSVENAGSTMASMPHYLSTGVNAMAADGVEKAFEALMEMLMLSVTAVEEIVLFVINMMTSTYVCLITLAVSGSLHVAIEMIEDAAAAINKTVASISGDLASDLSTFQDAYNDFVDSFSGVPLIGSSIPKLNVTKQIDELNNVTVDPSSLDAGLEKLNSSIPTFSQVKNFTDNVISFPFELVKQQINGSLANYTFDKSIFPVAEKQALTFCSDNSSVSNFFDKLVHLVLTAKTIFLIVLIILAVLACVPMAYLEIRRWRTMRQRAILLQRNSFDPMDVIYIASRPYTTTAGIKISSRFKSPKTQILARWFVAYITSTPALFVLALGVAGLFSCLCQYIILKVVEKEVPALADEVGDFADKVVKALTNASEQWALDANNVINTTNTKVNSDVFGWVNVTTTALNDTLNAFTDEMSTVLNATFGGTILYDPITEVLNCLIGLKIAGIEKALTWVSDHAHVTFPEFRSDVFSIGAAESVTNGSSTDSFLSSPGDVTTDSITNAVIKVTDKLEDGIQTEAAISASLIGLWLLVALIGLIRVWITNNRKDKTRAEGGPIGYTSQDRGAPPAFSEHYDAANFPHFGSSVSSGNPHMPSTREPHLICINAPWL
ncbi:putative plasma membrane fusion protein prm1 [Xylogone sp. PMI_703]|nr:putative plasma membrane fusion protein prm1 [Xylogone sp. PMI_703]